METKTNERTYREIPFGEGVCPVCDETVDLSLGRRVGEKSKLYVHGPRGARCEGSRQLPKPWLEATGLPGWGEMSELDRGAALLHVWKRNWEGAMYAISDYSCRYLDEPVLVGLERHDACRHAWLVTGGWEAVNDRLGADEVDRLYNLALDAERSEVAAR